jgi:hypothetical protein
MSVFDSRPFQIFWEVVGLERGPLILVSTIEELLRRKSSGSGLEDREYGRRDPPRWPRDTHYPQKLTLTSPTSGGRSVGVVRFRTKAKEFVLFVWQTSKEDPGVDIFPYSSHLKPRCNFPAIFCYSVPLHRHKAGDMSSISQTCRRVWRAFWHATFTASETTRSTRIIKIHVLKCLSCIITLAWNFL